MRFHFYTFFPRTVVYGVMHSPPPTALIFWARLVVAKNRLPVFIRKSPPPLPPPQGRRHRWFSYSRRRRHGDNVSDRKAIFPLNGGRPLNARAMLQVLVVECFFFSKKRLDVKIIRARKTELDVFNTEKYGSIRDRSKRKANLYAFLCFTFTRWRFRFKPRAQIVLNRGRRVKFNFTTYDINGTDESSHEKHADFETNVFSRHACFYSRDFPKRVSFFVEKIATRDKRLHFFEIDRFQFDRN